MHSALLGMGSNINPEYHLLQASMILRHQYPTSVFSHVYQSAAVGMQGDDFLNACCFVRGVPERDGLEQWLKEVEDRYFRDRSKGSWKPRTLDLDVLMYDEQVVDDDVYRYAHVFVPASDVITLALPQDEQAAVTRVGLDLVKGGGLSKVPPRLSSEGES